MIGLLEGIVVSLTEKELLILTSGGVGYRVFPAGTLLAMAKKGEKIRAEICTVVRENEISLYGFGSSEEQVLFRKLLTVSGIGPKMGLAMVSVPPQQFLRAIEEGDIAFLTRIPGLGKKKSERLIIELRGKIDLSLPSEDEDSAEASQLAEAEEALTSLGYDIGTIKKTLKNAPTGLSAEGYVKYFLSSGS